MSMLFSYQNDNTSNDDLLKNPLLMDHLNRSSEPKLLLNRFTFTGSERSEGMLVFEINKDGKAGYRKINQKLLLYYINNIAETIDKSSSSESLVNPSKISVNYLETRDLRRLEFNTSSEPSIDIHRHSVSLILDPVKAIVTADSLLIIVQDNNDRIVNAIEEIMKTPQENTSLSFEVLAYDAVISAILALQTELYELYNNDTIIILDECREASLIPIKRQEEMRNLKNKVELLLLQVNSYKQVIIDLLDDDKDKLYLNLTTLKENPQLYSVKESNSSFVNYENIEKLLESHLMDYNVIEANLELIKSQMNSVEIMISLRLDIARNKLLITNTLFTLLACTVAFGSFITGIMGMNLLNYLETSPIAFFILVPVMLTIMIALFLTTVQYLLYAGIIPSSINSDNKPLKSLKIDK